MLISFSEDEENVVVHRARLSTYVVDSKVLRSEMLFANELYVL